MGVRQARENYIRWLCLTKDPSPHTDHGSDWSSPDESSHLPNPRSPDARRLSDAVESPALRCASMKATTCALSIWVRVALTPRCRSNAAMSLSYALTGASPKAAGHLRRSPTPHTRPSRRASSTASTCAGYAGVRRHGPAPAAGTQLRAQRADPQSASRGGHVTMGWMPWLFCRSSALRP